MNTGGLRKCTRQGTFIPRTVLRDRALSFRARGLLAHLLDRPPGWDVRAESLARESEHDGRDSVLSALRELGAAGYYRLERRRYASGQFAMGTAISEDPVSEWAADYAEYKGRAVPVIQQADGTYLTRHKDGTLSPDGVLTGAGETETGFAGPGETGAFSRRCTENREENKPAVNGEVQPQDPPGSVKKNPADRNARARAREDAGAQPALPFDADFDDEQDDGGDWDRTDPDDPYAVQDPAVLRAVRGDDDFYGVQDDGRGNDEYWDEGDDWPESRYVRPVRTVDGPQVEALLGDPAGDPWGRSGAERIPDWMLGDHSTGSVQAARKAADLGGDRAEPVPRLDPPLSDAERATLRLAILEAGLPPLRGSLLTAAAAMVMAEAREPVTNRAGYLRAAILASPDRFTETLRPGEDPVPWPGSR